MNKRNFIVGVLLILTNNVSAQGDVNYFEFYPTSALQLGKGFVKDDFTKTFRDALTTDGNDTSTNSAISSFLGMSVVYDAQTLKDKFHLDTKMEARYLTFKASASFNLDFSSVFQSNSLVILLEANSEFGQVRLKNPKIDPNSEPGLLLKQGKTGYDIFKTNYGTHFVNAIRRGISVYVLITISNISRDLQNKIGLQTSGEFNLAAASGSLKVEISKEIQNASEQKRLDFKVLAKGGKGIGSLDGIIKSLSFDTNTLEKIMAEIGKYVSNLDYQSAAPIGYFTTPYNQYGLDFRDIWTDERERKVQEITKEYNRLYIIDGNLERLLDKENYKFLLIDSTRIIEINKYSKLVKQKLSELAGLHKASLLEPDVTKIKVPDKLDIDLSKLIPKLPNFDILHDGTSLDFPIFRKLPLDFLIFSDANIPSNLKLIENIELLGDEAVAVDFKSILKTKKINIEHIKLINEVYFGNQYTQDLDKELKKFEDGVFKSITTEWGSKEVHYSVRLTDVFGRVFIKSFYKGSYNKRSDGFLSQNYFPLNANKNQYFLLPYQKHEIFVEIPVYSFPSNTDTLYLFRQPIMFDAKKQIDYTRYYNIEFDKFFTAFGYTSSTKPLGLVSYSMADVKKYNVIQELVPLSFPFDAITYYWSITPNKILYNEKTQTISNYKGMMTVPLEKIIGETKIISISIQ